MGPSLPTLIPYFYVQLKKSISQVLNEPEATTEKILEAVEDMNKTGRPLPAEKVIYRPIASDGHKTLHFDKKREIRTKDCHRRPFASADTYNRIVTLSSGLTDRRTVTKSEMITPTPTRGPTRDANDSSKRGRKGAPLDAERPILPTAIKRLELSFKHTKETTVETDADPGEDNFFMSVVITPKSSVKDFDGGASSSECLETN